MNDENTTPDNNPIYGCPFAVLINHFRDNDLRFSHDPEKRTASLTMQSRSGVLFKCRFRFDTTGEVFQIDIQNPLLIQEKFRSVAAEFLTRANRGLVVGCFQFDFEDGETVFHASHIMDEGKLTDEIITRLFRTSLSTCDRYWQGLMKVLYAGDSAQDAVDLCELYRFEEESVEDTAPEIMPASSTEPTVKRPRRRTRKGAARKGQQDQTPQQDLPSQSASPNVEHQEDHPERDGEGEDRKAA